MTDIEEFFVKLKESMDNQSEKLKNGNVFLPEYLEGRVLTRDVFPTVIKELATALNLRVDPEYRNNMPLVEYECGNYQVVDYVLKKAGSPQFFVELESLDRAQLYLFWEHRGVTERDNDNKLWYYYGTLVNHYTYHRKTPRYYVWLLVLPNREVRRYQLWDITPEYNLFHPSLGKLIYQNPYLFYDHLIKSAARLFITKHHDFKHPRTNKWERRSLVYFQDVCELVFITCTVDRLIISRGRDRFDPQKEKSVDLEWYKKGQND